MPTSCCRYLALGFVLCSVLTACDVHSPNEPELPRPLFLWVEDEDEMTGSADIANWSGNTNTTAPVWSGEDPAAGAFPNEVRICPGSVWSAFTVVHKGRIFNLDGVFVKAQDLSPMPINGLPRAKYWLPPGEFKSTDGTPKISGGTVTVECNITVLRVLDTEIYVGRLIGEWYEGSSSETSGTGSGYGGGWAFEKTGVNTNGAGDGWQTALYNYLEYEACTPGWAILVEDVMVCDGS